MKTFPRRVLSLVAAAVVVLATSAAFIAASPTVTFAAFPCPGGTPGGSCRGYGIDVTTAVGARWAGSYAVDEDTGPGEQWIVGTCVQDSSGHPPAWGGGNPTVSMLDWDPIGQALLPIHPELVDELGTARFLLEPTVAMLQAGVPGSTPFVIAGVSHTLNQWWAGEWIYAHFVAGDGPVGGSVAVATSSSSANQAAQDLQAISTAWQQPWASFTGLDVVNGTATTIVTSANGNPIPGLTVRFDAATSSGNVLPSGPPLGVTGSDGSATYPITFANGAGNIDTWTVSTIVDGPGGAAVYVQSGGQDLVIQPATFVEIRSNATAVENTPLVFGEVDKTSSDASFSVEGLQFQLIDDNGAGAVVATGTVTGGVVTFPGVDPTSVTGPLVAHEVPPTNGLAPAADIALPWPMSSDPDAPTVVSIVNSPSPELLIVRKVFDQTDITPPDAAGFGFTVTRDDGRDFGTTTTAADGRTNAVTVTAGTYRVCEVAAPAWWTFGLPSTCETVVVTPGVAAAVELVWTNVVGTPTCSTSLVDDADGDHLLSESGGPVTDTVHCAGLVPGTQYSVDGELHVRNADATGTPTGITATTTFVATSPVQDVTVQFTVGDGYACTVLVAGETLRIGSRVVTTHLSLDDEAQTIYVPQIGTRAQSSNGGQLASAGDGMTDVVEWCGLPIGEATMSLAWQTAEQTTVNGSPQIDAAGNPVMACTPLSTSTATQTFTVTSKGETGQVTMPTLPVPTDGRGVFVAFEAVSVGGTEVASHRDCNSLAQTIWRPTLSTQRAVADLTAPGTSTDVIQVEDLPPASVLGDRTVTISGGLHQHALATTSATWQCNGDNRIATVSVLVDRGNGEYRSSGERFTTAVAHSYAEQITIAPGAAGPPASGVDGLTGTADGTWASEQHGCGVDTQSFVAVAAKPATVRSSASLPRTGGDVDTTLMIGAGLVGLGAIAQLAHRRRRVGR